MDCIRAMRCYMRTSEEVLRYALLILILPHNICCASQYLSCFSNITDTSSCLPHIDTYRMMMNQVVDSIAVILVKLSPVTS